MEIGSVNPNNAVNLSGQKNNVPMQKDVKETSASNNTSLEKSKAKIDQKELDSSIKKANMVLFKNNTHLKFAVHSVTKDVMVKIIDDETGEVLKEIPPEKLLDMVAKLWEIAGIVVDEKR